MAGQVVEARACVVHRIRPTFAPLPSTRFTDPSSAPDMASLARRVGRGMGVVEHALGTIGGRPGQIAHTWRFSKTSGWYLTYDRGTKRLFYLFPKQGDLLLKLVFNATGVSALRAADLPAPVLAKLAQAKTHAEGTMLEFTAAEFNAALLGTLLRIKVGSMR